MVRRTVATTSGPRGSTASSHLLSQFDYVDVAPDVVELPTMREIPYVRPPMHEQTFVPRIY